MKELSTQELEQITRTRPAGVLPDVCIRATDGQRLFIQLEDGETVPDGYEPVSVLGILLYLTDLAGLLHPVIDVRHGDPVRAAQQVAEALRGLA